MVSATLIYRTKYPKTDDLASKVLPKLYEITTQPNKTPQFIRGGMCSFHNVDEAGKRLNEWDEFREFMDFVQPHIDAYVNSLGLQKVAFEGMWANRYPPGTFVIKHDHKTLSGRQVTFIGVLFYIQKPENSGNLFIEGKEIDIEQGDVIMFETSMEHWTEPNKSSTDKFVIGMELVEIKE